MMEGDIMKVKEIMTANAKRCTPTSTLAEAAGLMWQNDCGILPVVAAGDKLIGLVTDRDICMAAMLKNRDLANISVEEVISGKVFSCKPEDDVHMVLETMGENKVRRLPVVAADGKLEGILSLNDLVLKAEKPSARQVPELSYDDVMHMHKSICQHRLPTEKARATTAV
jgi:CBS domain-containing protein